MLIYEIGAEGRTAAAQYEKTGLPENHEIPAECLRRALSDYPKYLSYRSFDISPICRRKTSPLTVNSIRSAPAR